MNTLDPPLRVIALLLLCTLVLGVAAFAFSFHGALRGMLRVAFFSVGGLAIIGLPLVTRKR